MLHDFLYLAEITLFKWYWYNNGEGSPITQGIQITFFLLFPDIQKKFFMSLFDVHVDLNHEIKVVAGKEHVPFTLV